MLCSTGTTVIRVNANDDDINQNALVTYIIGPGGRDNFGIDPNDGDLYIVPNSNLVVDHPPTYYNITVGCNFCRPNIPPAARTSGSDYPSQARFPLPELTARVNGPS